MVISNLNTAEYCHGTALSDSTCIQYQFLGLFWIKAFAKRINVNIVCAT